jgi:lysozyme
MIPSKTCETLVRSFEGEVLSVYPDPATGGAPWTGGVGHTGPDVKRGMVVTKAISDAWLHADLARFGVGVTAILGGAKTTQGQFDALTSLAFNIGLANLATSTLIKKHLARDYAGAADQFARWNRGNGQIMAGLTRRRAAEAAMYRGPIA